MNISLAEAYHISRSENRAVLQTLLPNGVSVIILPNGDMKNVFGDENVERVLGKNYDV